MKYTEYKSSGSIANTASANALIAICETPESDPTTMVITVRGLANSINGIGGNAIPIMTKSTPANSGVTTTQGTIFFDDQYLYVVTSNNTVKRVALSTF